MKDRKHPLSFKLIIPAHGTNINAYKPCTREQPQTIIRTWIYDHFPYVIAEHCQIVSSFQKYTCYTAYMSLHIQRAASVYCVCVYYNRTKVFSYRHWHNSHYNCLTINILTYTHAHTWGYRNVVDNFLSECHAMCTWNYQQHESCLSMCHAMCTWRYQQHENCLSKCHAMCTWNYQTHDTVKQAI